MTGEIGTSLLEKYREESNFSISEGVVKEAIKTGGLEKVALNNEAITASSFVFSNEIKTGKATSQERSGRCWMFAGLNVMRNTVINDLNLENFELSQAYPFFWDKFEKANYFLEGVIRTIDEDIYSRIVMWLLKDPMQDGGQWDMFTSLVKKYGVVPKSAMPETFHSRNSPVMNTVLTAKLRDYAKTLRHEFKLGKTIDDIRNRKEAMLGELYKVLVYFLGNPPDSFNFEVKDKDKNLVSDYKISPLEFYNKYVKINLSDYVSLINAPTPDKPYNKTYTVDYLGSVWEGDKILYLNVDPETLKDITKKQLLDNEPVWFGCDVRLQCEKKKGIMHEGMYLFDNALGIKTELNKAERLLYGESLLTHAMVFTGVHLVNEKIMRWKVENSWGEDRGEKGYYTMSDKWFDEYNYQVVVHKKYLSENLINALEEEPTILPPWDPMGSLAVVK